MATISQMYANIVVGMIFSACSLGMFGLAVRFGFHGTLAPRSWARPPEVLKNVIKAPYAFRWITWSLSMDYSDLLEGVPGTGTRDRGWSGPPLKVNLDGILMLKFHALLLKVTALATFLCIAIILPINLTASCDTSSFGAGTCEPLNNLTDFERTTIAHIPPMQYNETIENTNEYELQLLNKSLWGQGVAVRYFVIVAVGCILSWYTCHLIWEEWIEMLALRRIYYLECDHYSERLDELDMTVDLHDTRNDPPKPKHPWLPNPELRETVPNIPLYSCLYQLPNEFETVDLPNTATDLERKLAASVNFFDQCVPNQPGFTSSVAALTILPDPSDVSEAWKKWYVCSRRLRKLRYIRKLIRQRIEEENENESEEADSVAGKKSDPPDDPEVDLEMGLQDGDETKALLKPPSNSYLRPQVSQQQLEAGSSEANLDQPEPEPIERNDDALNDDITPLIDTGDLEEQPPGQISTSAVSQVSPLSETPTSSVHNGTTCVELLPRESVTSLDDDQSSVHVETTGSLHDKSHDLSRNVTGETSDDNEGDTNDVESPHERSGIQASDPSRNITSKGDELVGSHLPGVESLDDNSEHLLVFDHSIDEEAMSEFPVLDNIHDGEGNRNTLWNSHNIASNHEVTSIASPVQDSSSAISENKNQAEHPELLDHRDSGLQSAVSQHQYRSLSSVSFASVVSDREAKVETAVSSAPADSINRPRPPMVETNIRTASSSSQVVFGDVPGPPTGRVENETFSYSKFDAAEFAAGIGFVEETLLENRVNGLGIEQLSVYAREFAQSSSAPCPYGCASELHTFSTVEALRELEVQVLESVEEANAELMRARVGVNLATFGVYEQPDIDEAEELKNVGKDISAGKSPESKSSEDKYIGGRFFADDTPSLRRRPVAVSLKQQWQRAQSLVTNIQNQHKQGQKYNEKKSACASCWSKSRKVVENNASYLTNKLIYNDGLKTVVSALDHPTYAVVTFTSRQAALAARQCQADGSGLIRWLELEELPVAPLADAPPCDFMFCRGCCRPVTLTINEKEKRMRGCISLTLYIAICCLYTVPLTLTSQLLNPANLAQSFPNWDALQSPDSFFFRVLSGISSGLLYTLFFSLCPQIFKALANFEGNVSSRRTSDDKALKYYWYFMMVTAFSGAALAQMLWSGLVSGLSLGEEFKDVLFDIANSIPTQQAPVWINWMIVRFMWTLPFSYMCQANTFLFAAVGLRWCGRIVRGGGPGGPPPYRLFVDSGTVLLCVLSMAPVCPLLAPIALAYFAVSIVSLRWLLLFVYRPMYDAGAIRWTDLHDIIISAVIFGQVMVATMLFLRKAYLAGLLMGIPLLSTFYFHQACKLKFLRQYKDASLLQTSRLDGWDRAAPTSMESREEYRRWLVDCHKASYVPICLAGSESLLTVEPAVVVPCIYRSKSARNVMEEVQESPSLGTQRGAIFNRLGKDDVVYSPSASVQT